ncbi:MAG: BON domain-containing protein [Betaproteobacteria bacterium]
MNTRKRMTLLAAMMAAAGLMAAGCGERSAERVGTSIDRTTSKVAASTEAAVDKAASAVGDAAITGSVKTALIAEPGLKALEINVDTAGGIVTLTGTVDSSANKARAVQVAQAVTGVVSVVDRLEAKTTG